MTLLLLLLTYKQSCVKTCWCILKHNISCGADIVQAPFGKQIKAQRQMEKEGRKPLGEGLMSQFHCNNGARALCIVAFVHSHGVYQLTRKLHHVLSLCYWSCITGPPSISTDEEISLTIICCEWAPATSASACCIIQNGAGKWCSRFYQSQLVPLKCLSQSDVAASFHFLFSFERSAIFIMCVYDF